MSVGVTDIMGKQCACLGIRLAGWVYLVWEKMLGYASRFWYEGGL